MYGYKRHLAVAVALGVCLVALTGSALAAPPAEPPGQEKKAEPATPAAPAANAPGQQNTAPGQEKKATPAPAAATKKEKTHGVNATTGGVKPSNTTHANPHWTTAGHQPDVSKRYGNGKTAAQIATSRGAPASEPMYGPGNSQPHKVCGKNGHYVDVHAVKTYTGNRCSTSASAALGSSTSSSSVMPQTAAAATSASSSSAASAGSSASAGGVLGAEHTSGAAEAGGVAGAFATIGSVAAGSLPFTGFPLWAVALLALVAIALGVTLWRHGRPATRDVV
jgi:hypothetical protein